MTANEARKKAARNRQRETGEPYPVAWRAVGRQMPQQRLLTASLGASADGWQRELTASLGTSVDGGPVQLTLEAVHEGGAGLNCVITGWWPGRPGDQTDLLTALGTSLHDCQCEGALDIVVSSSPEVPPAQGFTFPHTTVPRQQLVSWVDELIAGRFQTCQDAGCMDVAGCRRLGVAIPKTVLIVEEPDIPTLRYLGDKMRMGRAAGVSFVVTLQQTPRHGWDNGRTVPMPNDAQICLGPLVCAAIQMGLPDDGNAPGWATLHTQIFPHMGLDRPRLKSQPFRIAATA